MSTANIFEAESRNHAEEAGGKRDSAADVSRDHPLLGGNDCVTEEDREAIVHSDLAGILSSQQEFAEADSLKKFATL